MNLSDEATAVTEGFLAPDFDRNASVDGVVSLGVVYQLNSVVSTHAFDAYFSNAQAFTPSLQVRLDTAIRNLPTRSYFPEVG